MFRLLALLLFPLVANAATFWSFDWETLPTANTNESEGIFYQGNCFEKALGDPFNSIELSTKYVRTGTKSARLYTDSKYGNHQGKRSCASMYKTETITINNVVYNKHRMEPKFAYSANGLADFRNYQVGEERWFRYSFYLPSNEGTFNNWNTGPYSSKGMMIMQIFAQGGASGGTHEVAFVLSGGPKMKVEQVYGTKADEEIFGNVGTFNLKKDAWNDVVFMHLPDYDSDGRLKVWLNCSDWASCTPIVDRSGPTSIYDFTDRYWKGGNYEMNVPVWDRAVAQYVDSHKMGKKDGETEAQMLALMSDVFTSNSGGSGGDGDQVTVSNLTVNNSDPINSNQDPINFTVTDVNDISNCTMGGPSQSIPLAVKWDYVGNTSGKFAGVDTTGWPITGSVTCYDLSYFANPNLADVNMGEFGVVDSRKDATTELLDHWGYTTGRRIYKANAGSAYALWTYGTANSVVANDKVGFDITYSCTGASCNNLYFDISHNVTTTGNKTIRLAGSAGALAITSTNEAVHGTSIVPARNYTMPDNTYRVSTSWIASESNNYKIRIGWLSDAGADLTVDMLQFVMRKNWTTKVLTAPVTYGVVDTTAPVVENCTLTNNSGEGGGYRAYIGCTADEIGGIDYAMITTSDTSPNVADVQAGTGSIWFSQKDAATADISFEASGVSYQDLWSWIARCDAATPTNCSVVAGATFDAGVTESKEKVIAFNSTNGLLKRNGSAWTGTADHIKIYSANPLLNPGLYPVAEAVDISVVAGSVTLKEADLSVGSINALTLNSSYWFFIFDVDKDPFAFGEIPVTEE